MAHGTEDDFVEPSQAQEIYHAIPNSHKCLKMIPKAGHQNTLSTGSTALYADMCQFFLEQI
jgi:esterase/lipase